MPARIAALVLAGLALSSLGTARAAEGIFGDFLSRPPGAETPKFLQGTEWDERAREAQGLRRAHWQVERARIGRTGHAQGRPEQAVAVR